MTLEKREKLDKFIKLLSANPEKENAIFYLRCKFTGYALEMTGAEILNNLGDTFFRHAYDILGEKVK